MYENGVVNNCILCEIYVWLKKGQQNLNNIFRQR